jgi:hypothetical protein
LFESTLLENQTAALWNDPIYGFNNYQNFVRWSAFNNDDKGIKATIMRAEMKTYFGLSDLQIAKFVKNWPVLI